MPKLFVKNLFVAHKSKVISAAIIVIGLSTISISLTQLWDRYITTHRLRLPIPTATITHSTAKPNETPINTHTTPYTVPADQPRLLELPTIGASGFIQRIGLDQQGALATPSSIYTAGWYTGSAKPGDPGVSIIDGHVHGRFDPGIFYKLKNIQVGDTLSVTYGNGKRIDFSVVKVSSYNTNEATTHMFEKLPTVNNELVIVTCGGTFDKHSNLYAQRVLVYAQRKDNA